MPVTVVLDPEQQAVQALVANVRRVIEAFDRLDQVLADWEPPEPPLVRSPLGAPEDPNRWTLPARDQMHWTAPETGEEVPRWLA